MRATVEWADYNKASHITAYYDLMNWLFMYSEEQRADNIPSVDRVECVLKDKKDVTSKPLPRKRNRFTVT